MGMMTWMTGKPRIQRQLETMDKKLDDQFMPMLINAKDELGIDSGEEFNIWMCSLKAGYIINQYVTYWLRTKLDYHPKWTTEGNYNDERGKLIGLFTSQLYSVKDLYSTSSLIIVQRANIMLEGDSNGPLCDSLVKDMFKVVPIRLLFDDPRYQSIAVNGLDCMVNDCEALSLRSSLNHDINFIKEIIGLVKLGALA